LVGLEVHVPLKTIETCSWEGCTSPVFEEGEHCLPCEKVARLQTLKLVVRFARDRDYLPPLCDIDGCTNHMLLDGFDPVGTCGDHLKERDAALLGEQPRR
jgi:hypothetical protein